MSAQSNILREYLVSLGFRVNKGEQRRADLTVAHMDRRVTQLGKVAASAAVSIVTLSTVFAKSMERLWYSARYADSTVDKLQQLEFGARNIGIEGGKATGALKNMAASIRSNPGLIGLLNSLGVKVQGRDKADVMLDLVGALKQMPFYIAERYASLFGIDPETLFNMAEGLEKMREAAKMRKQMSDEMGVDMNRAAELSKEYMQSWREVEERVGIFGASLMILLQGPIKDFLGASNELVKHWTEISNRMNKVQNGPAPPGSTTPPGFWSSIWTGLTGIAEGDRVKLSPQVKEGLGLPREEFEPMAPRNKGDVTVSRAIEDWRAFQKWRDRKTGYNYGMRVATDPDAVDAVQSPIGPAPTPAATAAAPGAPAANDPKGSDAQAYLASLEQKYGLPPGLLDRVWRKESSRGKNMRSPAGAKGHFGFMDKTAKEYGLKNPDDFNESADASARKWRDLLKQYGGDVELAAAAYNWGDGNMARYGLGKMPKETQDYVKDVAGSLTVNQETNIHVHGVKDPGEAAKAVSKEQRVVNGDIVRTWSPKVK